MKKDIFKTVVIFRKYEDNEVIALFPYDKETNDCCNSYMHLGQHANANYIGVISQTKPANESEYKDLFNELENIGYNLKIQLRALKLF